MLHTFDVLFYTKNEKYMKNVIVFLIFRVAGSIKSMEQWHSLDEKLNFASNEYSHSKFE